MSDAERDRTGTKKAQDWDGLEQIGKRHPVGIPKVHLWKLRQGDGAIYGEDRLMLQVVNPVAEHGLTGLMLASLDDLFLKPRGSVPPYSLRSLRYENNKSELPRGRVPTGLI